MKKESKIVLAEKDVNDYVNKKINLEELAQRTGCSRFTAAKKLRELGRKDVIDRINENRALGPANLTLKQIERILQKARAGETAINISMEYNVDPATIRYHLKLNGIQVKRAKRCDWVEVKSKTLSIDDDFSSIIPNNIFSQVNRLMTRSMRTTSADI